MEGSKIQVKVASPYSLATLPVDALHPILALVLGNDIARLWLTGDSRLLNLMGGAGGVSRFELKFADSFPSIIRHFRLYDFKISIPSFEECSYSFTRGLRVQMLPSTLRNLVLNVPNALSHICLISSDKTLGTLFPNLTSLCFSRQYRPEFDCTAFFASLLEITPHKATLWQDARKDSLLTREMIDNVVLFC